MLMWRDAKCYSQRACRNKSSFKRSYRNMFQAIGVKLLESVDEVVTLDNKLKDKTEYTNLLDSLKKMGGGKPREHVFLIMKRLFSNQLQSKFNRKGNGEKISLENIVNI
ncbi:uncharacterized protein LOC124814736 isoform X2 [Hydra vulgaris]|uniref:uncharacterized protein LOC124814736 isoform X2 n=1 Tax=Hydra vulgaris TaxID=6087 RepID=UPI0032E9EB58